MDEARLRSTSLWLDQLPGPLVPRAALSGDVDVAYDTWYEIGERSDDLGDPFVRTDVLPADVLPVVVEPLVDAGETSVTVDRDFVLDLGTRFSRSWCRHEPRPTAL